MNEMEKIEKINENKLLPGKHQDRVALELAKGLLCNFLNLLRISFEVLFVAVSFAHRFYFVASFSSDHVQLANNLKFWKIWLISVFHEIPKKKHFSRAKKSTKILRGPLRKADVRKL